MGYQELRHRMRREPLAKPGAGSDRTSDETPFRGIMGRPIEDQTMPLRDDLFRQSDAIWRIAAKYGPSNVRLFGAVARGDERPDSDIDLLVDLADDRGFRGYLALAKELEALLNLHVDLLLARSLSPHFRPFVEADATSL